MFNYSSAKRSWLASVEQIKCFILHRKFRPVVQRLAVCNRILFMRKSTFYICVCSIYVSGMKNVSVKLIFWSQDNQKRDIRRTMLTLLQLPKEMEGQIDRERERGKVDRESEKGATESHKSAVCFYAFAAVKIYLSYKFC